MFAREATMAGKRCRRWRPYSVLRGGKTEHVKIICGSSGSIVLDIYNHSTTTTQLPRPLILYFPPLISTIEQSSPPSAFLSDDTTLIRINLRWSSSHPFPIPLHDTLFAYDWILANLVPAAPTSAFPRTRPPPTPIGIYGSFLGGSIATSLALTESHKTPQPRSRIAALAVSNSIFDFSTLAVAACQITQEKEPPSPDPENQEQQSLKSLSTLRTLFTSPGQAFDAFASPILFFRTSGLAIPRSWSSDLSSPSVLPPSVPSSTPPPWADLEFDPEFEPHPNNSSPLPHYRSGCHQSDLNLPISPPSRKSHLRFPPSSSTLTLPYTRLQTSSKSASIYQNATSCNTNKNSSFSSTHPTASEAESAPFAEPSQNTQIMRAQAQEFATLMRRSVRLHEMKARVLWGVDEDIDIEAVADARVTICDESEDVLGRSHSGKGKNGDDVEVSAEEGEWAREWFEERGVLR